MNIPLVLAIYVSQEMSNIVLFFKAPWNDNLILFSKKFISNDKNSNSFNFITKGLKNTIRNSLISKLFEFNEHGLNY